MRILGSASGSPWGNGVILYVVGLGTAFMTAFYMNRLMHKTFYTDARFVNGELVEHHHSNFDEHEATHTEEHEEEHDLPAEIAPHDSHGVEYHGHGKGTGSVHESPPSMMIPLYVLAGLSVIVGIALGPTKLFEKFMEPSVARIEIGPLAQTAPLVPEYAGWAISAVVAILGLVVASALYGKAKETGELVPEAVKARNPLYHFLMEKWYFDKVYDYVFITLAGRFADRVLWRFIDVRLIDGTANRIAGLVQRMSSGFKRVQTGYVRNYALGILFGVVVLIIGLLAQWSVFSGH